MTALGKLVRTTAFKLSLAYLVVFTVFAFATLVYVAWSAGRVLDEQFVSTIEAEITGLSEQYRVGGLRRLVNTVERRAREPGASLYLVTTQAGERLTGGAFAVAPLVVLGTHAAPLEGLPATHRPLKVHALAYAELVDERVARIRVFFDLYAVAVQLGVLPRSGSVGERAMMLLRGFGLRRP